MRTKKFDFLVYIGRFQPFHNGHYRTIQEAMRLSHRVIILLGSDQSPRTDRNPFSFHEREAMIKEAFPNYENQRLIIKGIPDYTYNANAWIQNVQREVAGFKAVYAGNKIGLIGFDKDQSTYYLKEFPQWEVINQRFDSLDATPIREGYLDNGMIDTSKVPLSTVAVMQDFMDTEEYKKLRKEFAIVQKSKAAWANSPYEPTFNTVDSVVLQAGHILMVVRNAAPGEGMLALPGGFLEQNETQLDGAIRELREETKIKCPVPVLKGALKGQETFDDPHRSSRGRTITRAFFFDLESREDGLYKVKGSSDARKALWIPLSTVEKKRTEMFEDHYHIIQHFVRRV